MLTLRRSVEHQDVESNKLSMMAVRRSPKGIAPASPEEIARRKELMNLWEESNRPGADKFVQAAKRKGIALTRKEAMHLISDEPVHQMYKPSPVSIGAVAARGMDTNWQMDIASLVQLPANENDDYRYILLAVNIFDRKCFAEPLKTKTPTETAEALEKMLGRTHKPEIISTDDGGRVPGCVFSFVG
jgi:hypothetical protein